MEQLVLAAQFGKHLLTSNERWHSILKWTATIFMAISAILVSFSVDLAGLPVVFVGFLIGHIIWSFSAWILRETALLTLNISFIPIDLYAIIIRT